MRRVLALLIAACALSLLGQSAGVTMDAGVNLTGGGTDIPSRVPRVIDLQYTNLYALGGIRDDDDGVATRPCDTTPSPSATDAVCAKGEFSANMLDTFVFPAVSYTPTTGVHLDVTSASEPLEKFFCRRVATPFAPCANTTGGTCGPVGSGDGAWRQATIVRDDSVVPPRYYNLTAVASTLCDNAFTGIGFLNVQPGLDTTHTFTAQSYMYDLTHWSRYAERYMAQWIAELPFVMTQFPAHGGLLADGNFNTYVSGTPTGWSSTGAWAKVDLDLDYSTKGSAIHGTAVRALARTAGGDWISADTLIDVGLPLPLYTPEVPHDRYYWTHGIVDCQNQKAEFQVEDVFGAAVNFTHIDTPGHALAGQEYRVLYWEDHTGWTPAVTAGGSDEFARIPHCSVTSKAGGELAVGRVFVLIAGVPANATQVDLRVSMRPLTTADAQLNTLTVFLDEWYMGHSRVPSLDPEIAFPNTLNAAAVANSQGLELSPALKVFPFFENGCVADGANESLNCQRLIWAIAEQWSDTRLGFVGTAESRTYGSPGHGSCVDLEGRGGAAQGWGRFTSLTRLALEASPEFLFLQAVVGDGVADIYTPADSARCTASLGDIVRDAGVGEVYFFPATTKGDTDAMFQYWGDGGDNTATLGMWADQYVVRLIDSGALYDAVDGL